MSAKELLQRMTLARWIIALGLIALAALAVASWRVHARRVELEAMFARGPGPDDLSPVERTIRNIQILGKTHTKLYQDAAGVGLVGQKDAQTYIRERAGIANLGQVEIRPSQPQYPFKGVVDNKFTISDQSPDKGKPRRTITNFMYELEKSRRMRVTGVRFSQEKPGKAWDFGNDLWKWEVEVTSREKQEPQPAAPAR